MRLNIKAFIPEGNSIDIHCNNRMETLYSFDNSLTFDIPEIEHTTLIMEERVVESNYTYKHIIVFLLTMIFQGMWNIIIMNSDSKWYKDVNAYRMIVVCDFFKDDDINIQLSLTRPKWSEEENTWLLPEVSISPNFETKVRFEKQPQSVKNAFFSYIKRIISILTVALCILIILMVISVEYHMTLASVAIILLIVSLTAITGWSIVHEYRRCKQLIGAFALYQLP